MKVKEPLFDYINPENDFQVLNGDSLKVLKSVEDGKFDLIITSPPYNVGKSYETKTSIEKYLETQEEIIDELVRTLSEKGNLCWQVGNYVNKGEDIELVERFILALPQEEHWNIKSKIITSNYTKQNLVSVN